MFFVIIQSKNKKSIILLLSVLNTLLNKLKITKKLINKKNSFIKFSILKSPHIHKEAQQHLGFNLYQKKIILNVINFDEFFLLVKILVNKLLYDIFLKLYCNFNKKNHYILLKNLSFLVLKFINFLNSLHKKIKLNFLLKQGIKVLNWLNFSTIQIL